jgi:HD-GYP domain-containing protein (c-di-GMP phosphodiesterase class II)
VRIVAVTDIFDALISRRSYKEYWSNKQEIQALKQLAGEKLDQYCVNALLDNMAQVENISSSRFLKIPTVKQRTLTGLLMKRS